MEWRPVCSLIRHEDGVQGTRRLESCAERSVVRINEGREGTPQRVATNVGGSRQ
jgi:hypothetical protein